MFTNHVFHGGDSTPEPVKQVYLNGTLVTIETYFSPDDTPGPKLENLIYSANESVYFMTYAFTLDYLADALTDRAYNGVRVAGVFDYSQVNDPYSVYSDLVNKGLMISHGRNGSVYVHHKAFIVDDIVWTGSMNPSNSGTTANDENSIVIHSPAIARLFKEAFYRVFAENSLIVKVHVDYNGEPVTGALVSLYDSTVDYRVSNYTFNGWTTLLVPRGDEGDHLRINVSYHGVTTTYNGNAEDNPYTVSIPSPSPPGNWDHIVINEVFIDSGNMWIELYNPTSNNYSLAGHIITDKNYMVSAYEGIAKFPSTATIHSHEFLVIAYNGSAFYSEYGFKPDYEIEDTLPDVPDMIVSGGFRLDPYGDEIILLNNEYSLIDLVYYGSSWYPQNYSVDKPNTGYSIARQTDGLDTDDPANDFIEAIPTPGSENSYTPPPVYEPLYLVIPAIAFTILFLVILLIRYRVLYRRR